MIEEKAEGTKAFRDSLAMTTIMLMNLLWIWDEGLIPWTTTSNAKSRMPVLNALTIQSHKDERKREVVGVCKIRGA